MIRLAHFVTHPIQYFAPLYREIARAPDIRLTVFFGSRFGTQPSFDEGFNRVIEFDVPLLAGYQHEFLDNRGSGIPDAAYQSFDCPGLPTQLAGGNFDAFWMHGWSYKAHWQALRAARKVGLPYLVRGETNQWSRPGSLWRRLARKLLVGRMLRAAAACLYVGLSNRRFLADMGVPANRLFPAHYSVEGERFRTIADQARPNAALRQRCGASPDTFVVATVAKAIARKRLPDIIRAIGALGPRAQLWVLGDGCDRPQLEALAAEVAPNRVVWHGLVNQSEIPAVLAGAQAFVLCSDDEPWGLAVNEAMACGLPVLCSDRVGCASDLVREGQTGYSYPVGDVAALTALLARWLASPEQAQRMGQAARDLVLSEYDVTTTARQIVAAVRAVARRPRCPEGPA